MTVLVITWSGDSPAVRTVCDEVERRGLACVRVDTDSFARDVGLAVESSSVRRGAILRWGDQALDTREVRAVWYRRLRFEAGLPESLSPSMRNACRREAKAALDGWLATLHAFQIDRDERAARASHKPLQLELARDVGLEAPATLVTNDAQAARAFRAACGRPLVAKPLTQFRIDDEPGAAARVVLTSAVGPADLDDDAGLALSPMIFQERVEKALELRVIVVGAQLFAASIDSQASAHTAVDWRAGARELVGEWKRYTLPADIAARVVELVARFQLHYSAVDMILTPDGRHVFLESNPQGEFAWLEDFPPHLTIARAIAERLVAGARGEVPA